MYVWQVLIGASQLTSDGSKVSVEMESLSISRCTLVFSAIIRIVVNNNKGLIILHNKFTVADFCRLRQNEPPFHVL